MLKCITMAAMTMVLLGVFTQPVRSAPPGGVECYQFTTNDINNEWLYLGYLGPGGNYMCISVLGFIYNEVYFWNDSYDYDFYTFDLVGTTQFVVELVHTTPVVPFALYIYDVQTQQWQHMSCEGRLCRGEVPTGRVFLAAEGQKAATYSMYIYIDPFSLPSG